uniref:Uncharacterized protein n=1 Tax=Triticum urartu TaxID=4572 RepID=A0A8R7TN08_TRIUA
MLSGASACGQTCEHEMAKVFLDLSVCSLGVRHRIHPARLPVQSAEPCHQHRRRTTKTELPPQIRSLKCGLNCPSWDKLLFDLTYLGLAMKTGLASSPESSPLQKE